MTLSVDFRLFETKSSFFFFLSFFVEKSVLLFFKIDIFRNINVGIVFL